MEDTRESPAFTLIRLIEERGGRVDFYDPLVQVIPHLREHPEMSGRESVKFDKKCFSEYDAGLICTDHDGVDYTVLADVMKLLVDTRNATRMVSDRSNLVLA